MSFNIQAWNQSYCHFQEQVTSFNKKLQENSLNYQELDEIYQVVESEVKRLKKFVNRAEAQEEALESPGCCSPTSKLMWVLALLNGASKVCVIAGYFLAIFQSEATLKWIGVGVGSTGALFDATMTIYGNKVFLRGMEITALAKVDKRGLEHAKIFKKFLKRFKEVKNLEEQLIEQNRKHEKRALDQQIIIDLGPTKLLDEKIGACLCQYESLPTLYRDDDLYCRLISIFIQNLPNDDPLKRGLQAFEPRDIEDISQLATQPLPIHYLSDANNKKSEEKEKWTNEQDSRRGEEKIDLDGKKIRHLQQVHHEKLAYYKQLVAQRFKTKGDIAFFETSNGWHIDAQNGIKRVSQKSQKLFVNHSKKEGLRKMMNDSMV